MRGVGYWDAGRDDSPSPGPPATEERENVSRGHLLGGRVRYAQPRGGFRSGIEPVLLAAAIPARRGERVLEAGTGAGAALLCLAARVPETRAVGIERDAELALLAARNLAENGFAERISVLATDIADLPDIGVFDHACANPPWHSPSGTTSPDPAREAAKRATPDLLALWAETLARPLRRAGTLTFVLPAALLAQGIAALDQAGCGSLALLPLRPKPVRPAKLILLQGRKGGAGACRVLPGLVLHRGGGGYTEEAEAILRHGAAIPM